jgi:STE24 endopeptidase
MDASRRTTAANAYVGGLGPTKRVVLYDTLVADFPRDQVRLVVAHELAHQHHHDLRNGLLYLALVTPLGLLAVARLTDRLAPAPATGARRGAEVVPALALSVAVLSLAITTVSLQLSRAVEARADTFSLELTDRPRTLVDVQTRLAVRNVTDVDPLPITHALLSTHPTTLHRLGIAEAFARRGGSP